MKLTNIFTFLCETVKQIHFFLWNCARLIFFAENDFNYVFQFGHEILWSVLCKKWSFSCKPHLRLFFILAQFHVKTGWNWWFFFCFIWLKKWNWLMVSWVKTGIKLWNRPEVGREKKLSWRQAGGKKNKTDGTRLRRGRQFHFFPVRVPSVQFFFPTDFWTVSQFYASFHPWNHQPV